MFEVIGMISLFSFILLVLTFQYSLLFSGVVRKDLDIFGRFIAWIPFLPFIIMFIILMWYFSSLFFKKIFNFKQ
jgi:hypothetical protein